MKMRLAEAVQQALVKESGIWKASDISVSVEDIPPAEFKDKTKSSFSDDELLISSDYIK